MEKNYDEFNKLCKMLDDAKIPYERDDDDPNHDFYVRMRPDVLPMRRIKYYGKNEHACVCSIIYGYGSYGVEKGLLEISGLLTPEEEEFDSVMGYLTADDVFSRIKEHWDSINKEEEK